MIKILIQIPCYNEEAEIQKTIDEIKRNTFEIQNLKILIIDDGSNDNTLQIVRDKVDFVVSHKFNKGLGLAFQTGLNFAKENDFDYLINLDADNQYKSEYIKNLLKTIEENKYDIVIGARNFDEIEHFSFTKKKLQELGSWVIKIISKQKISDASSGFRVYSKKAIKKLNCSSKFSYTLDTIIQATDKNLKIGETKIKINKPTRKSRLFKSNTQFVLNQAKIILKCFAIYKPFTFFLYLSILPLFFGFSLFLRFLFFYFSGDGTGHVQSIIFGSTSLILGFILIALGVLGELIKHNRKIMEENEEKKF